MKRGITAGAAAGIVLGTADWIVNHVSVWLGEDGLARADRSPLAQTADFVSMFLDAGWAWAATAVLAGWLAARGTRMWPAAAAGFLALAFATVIDYGLSDLLGGPSAGGLAEVWLIASVLFGPPLGLVGALIHRRGGAGTLAALTVPAGAALAMVLFPPMEPDNPMDAPVRIAVWVAAAASSALILRNALRSRSLPARVTDPDHRDGDALGP